MLMSSDCFECEVMDWNLFYNLAKKVAKKVNKSGFKPDLIIGLARGGWVLARVLCDLVGVKDLLSLKVEHWGVTATPNGKAQLKYPLNIDLTRKKVLVVDDITDTGESLNLAVEHIKSLKSSEIKTATLRHITSSRKPQQNLTNYIRRSSVWLSSLAGRMWKFRNMRSKTTGRNDHNSMFSKNHSMQSPC